MRAMPLRGRPRRRPAFGSLSARRHLDTASRIDDPDATQANARAQILERAGRDLAGGGLGLFVLPPELNLVVARGQGSRIWDVAGREYIDYHLGSGPALLGHAHPAITAAVAAQVPKGTTYYFLNEPEIELAGKLVDAIPCADAVHYTGSGTEATFYACASRARSPAATRS